MINETEKTLYQTLAKSFNSIAETLTKGVESNNHENCLDYVKLVIKFATSQRILIKKMANIKNIEVQNV